MAWKIFFNNIKLGALFYNPITQGTRLTILWEVNIYTTDCIVAKVNEASLLNTPHRISYCEIYLEYWLLENIVFSSMRNLCDFVSVFVRIKETIQSSYSLFCDNE